MDYPISILNGKWPTTPIELDQQVEIVNAVADRIAEAAGNGDDINQKVENFAVWLGGAHNDIQVYAWQRLFGQITIDEMTEKTLVRYEQVQDKMLHSKWYVASSYSTIDHFPWPKVYLDGSTFEERLEEAAAELREDMDLTPPDMILSGQTQPIPATLDEAYATVTACLHNLNEIYSKYGKQTVIYDEQVENFLKWLIMQQVEIAVLGVRTLVSIYQLPLPKASESYDELSNKLADLIR